MLLSQKMLLDKGKSLIDDFCSLNNLPVPGIIEYTKEDWKVEHCAYYRHSIIHICISSCAKAASGEKDIRNWNWPGSVTDRTPLGVLAHELGHHCDVLLSQNQGKYSGDFSDLIRMESGELPISSYSPNTGEWFAEYFRLFLTNPQLLRCVRPNTYTLLTQHFTPCIRKDWLKTLGKKCPMRIKRALINKMKIKGVA